MSLAHASDHRTTRAAAPSPGEAGRRPYVLREVGVFLTVTAVLLACTTAVGLHEEVDVSRIDEAGPLGQAVMFGQALVPLAAAFAARWSLPRDQRRGWGFRRPTSRRLGAAWAFGLAATLPAAAVLWATGLASFDGDGFGPVVVLGMTVLVLPYCALALAEDVGWRGLLVQRLAEVAGPRTVVLVSGLAWAMFHWPLMMLLGGTPHGVDVGFAVASYTVGAVALGAVLTHMQLSWGIWPGVVAHAAVNATLYHVIEPLTSEHRTDGHLAGETGLAATVVLVLLALAWWRVVPLTTRGPGTDERVAAE